MKYLLLVLLLSACGGSSYKEGTQISETTEGADDLYIVAGQSNALRCDWSYFGGMIGAEVVNIAISGQKIEALIDQYNPEDVKGLRPKGIIFLHGESDGLYLTDLNLYIEKVEEYRLMISADTSADLTLYISTVGYFAPYPDDSFDRLRSAVVAEAEKNEKWVISYDDAKNFRDWGFLVDGVHFTPEGAQLVMEGIAASI